MNNRVQYTWGKQNVYSLHVKQLEYFTTGVKFSFHKVSPKYKLPVVPLFCTLDLCV